MLKTFTVAPEQDSVRTAFSGAPRAGAARLTLERRLAAFPEYLLKQYGVRVAIIRGKEMVVGGEHFAVIPFLPAGWDEDNYYVLSNANVPYWDGEQRLESLDGLLYDLSSGSPIAQALDNAVDAEDDEFFAGIPEVAYTGQQPEDFPLPVPIEWEPEPEQTPPSGIYPWTFWYRGPDGGTHQLRLEATYEDAQRAWDALSPVFEMTSRRP